MENSLLSLYLPEGLFEQFDISYMCSFCKRDTKEDGYIIQLVMIIIGQKESWPITKI
jgi:hypothetical protein